MTTTTTEASQVRKPRKPVEKRGFTEVGKFFAKLRIDLGVTTEEWAKSLGVSTMYINNIERANKEFDLNFVRKVFTVIPPEYYLGFVDIVAQTLGVLVIPSTATVGQVQQAFSILSTPTQPVDVRTETQANA